MEQKVKYSTGQKKMLDEIVDGLNRKPKSIPSKYFYDKRGSELFEQICSVQEYYLTDVEITILKENIDEIAAILGEGIELIEPGSGNSMKSRLLLDHLDDITNYVPVDISEKFLQKVVWKLQSEYPGITIKPVAADYTKPFHVPDDVTRKRRVVFFPGSTIGNFTRSRAREFLRSIVNMTGPDGGLLIGVDLKKDQEILEAAYNDSRGVTAAFNKNLLVRLNRELNSNFDPDLFEHRAFYNDEEGRIEMHLVSRRTQNVHFNGFSIPFEQGESIHTENSYKYTPEEFAELVEDIYRVERIWTDADDLFSVQYLVPA